MYVCYVMCQGMERPLPHGLPLRSDRRHGVRRRGVQPGAACFERRSETGGAAGADQEGAPVVSVEALYVLMYSTGKLEHSRVCKREAAVKRGGCVGEGHLRGNFVIYTRPVCPPPARAPKKFLHSKENAPPTLREKGSPPCLFGLRGSAHVCVFLEISTHISIV